MSPIVLTVLSVMAGGGIGALGFLFYRRMLDEKVRNAAQKDAEKIIARAKSQVIKIEKDAEFRAKDFETRARKNLENELRKEKQKMQNTELVLKEKEVRLERDYKRKDDVLQGKIKDLDLQTQRLSVSEKRLKEMDEKTKMQLEELESKLQSVSNMTTGQAKAELMQTLADTVRSEAALKLQKIEEEALQEADKRAKRVLSIAISRYASEVTTERTVSTIPLTGDEMKGKIIGREGRNIRALEAACGVDLIIDETPETVIISSFDPVRREIARRSLAKLIEDGRVHPARIEEVVDKVKSEIMSTMKDDGEKAAFDVGVHGLNPNIINILGGLRYRQSEGQNLLTSSLEVAHIVGLLADEIGADSKLGKRAGLLHAIGRGLDHSYEGSYAQVGAEFARKHGEKEDVCHAIRSHTGEVPAQTITAHLVQSAFNLARSRPGARRQNVEAYVRRLADLESVANSFDGVAHSYAIQAGKEIRVLVDSGKVTDEQAIMLSRDIARKIERELNYPGQVRVNVVRETRIVEHAR
ncbi:MAG: ribonuclease Y [Bdellovibrionales bacterium]|nr:ribonuclease Y [Bdellovibrionales bacterium]